MQQQRFSMICITAECSSVFTVNVKVFQRQEQLREFRCEKQSRSSLSERLCLDHWTPEKWSRVTEHSADINNEAPLCSLWFLLSDQHVRRLRSDPAGLRQTGLQPGPAAGSVSWPGEDEAVAADGGGRPLDDGVHALLLCPAEVETGSSPDPDSWKPGFLIGEQIGDSGAAAGLDYSAETTREPRRLVTVQQNRPRRLISSESRATEVKTWAELLIENSVCFQSEVLSRFKSVSW